MFNQSACLTHLTQNGFIFKLCFFFIFYMLREKRNGKSIGLQFACSFSAYLHSVLLQMLSGIRAHISFIIAFFLYLTSREKIAPCNGSVFISIYFFSLSLFRMIILISWVRAAISTHSVCMCVFAMLKYTCLIFKLSSCSPYKYRTCVLPEKKKEYAK